MGSEMCIRDRLSNYAIMLIMCEKNAFEIKILVSELCFFNFFSLCFYAYKLDKGHSDKMDSITKNLVSTSF